MKIYCLVISGILLSQTLFAQLDKGTWIVGGNGSFTDTKTTFETSNVIIPSDRTEISVSAPVGFFIIDKLAAGLKLSYNKFKDRVPDGGYTNQNRFNVGPFVRYYFLNKEKQFNLFSDISYQYGLYRFKPRKGNINTFSANVGFTGFFTTSVGLELLAGYYYTKESVKDEHYSKQKGFQMSLGFQFYLQKL